MKIYTRTGDDGTTSLSGGKRVPKYNIRVEAYGTIDELISWIGLLRDYKENNHRKAFLIYLQEQLMICASSIASDPDKSDGNRFLPDDNLIRKIEEEIDEMEMTLKPLENFVLPGGNILVSYCHIARCVCRRAERTVLNLNQTEKTPEIIYKFLNRLSDYIFILTRKLSLELDIEEIKWIY
jgi:cob(I)alamin adenosyltransferase